MEHEIERASRDGIALGWQTKSYLYPTKCHPIIEGYDPPEGWGWCYVDELFLDLGEDTTPQLGPIRRFV